MDGLLLAGGKSRRMGMHKGELTVRGVTFSERIVGELKKAVDTVYISYGEDVYREFPGCTVLRDEENGLGPVEGIIEGLRMTKSDRMVVLACDMPFMNAEFINFLSDSLDQHPDALAVVPMHRGRPHPLAAIYRKAALTCFETNKKQGDLSLMGAVHHMTAVMLPVPDVYADCLRNINTKEEYRCLQKETEEDVQIAFSEAEKLLLENITEVTETEQVDLFKAPGRVLREDVRASFDNPPFNRSPLDGYALRSSDTVSATKEKPVTLTVSDEVTAGDWGAKTLSEGEAVRIMTGAPIPDGADCVIRQEDTDYGEKTVALYKALKPWQNYCFQGEDFKKGDDLLRRGTRLNAASVGVLASAGKKEACVTRKIRAALITTGDEIQTRERTLKQGQIYNSNLYTVGAVMEKQGYSIVLRASMGDNAQEIADKIEEILPDVDIIVTTGGVSVGKKDIMHDVFSRLQIQRLFWRVKIKPGMPTLAGLYKGKPVVALSGNPYGAFVNAILFLNPVHEKLSGRKGFERIKVRAECMADYKKKSGITRYLRASYEDGKVYPIKGSNDSGVLSTACYANALIEIPAGTLELKKGDQVWALLI